MYDHIFTWSNAGDIVLDPFMGSGTTAMAATKLGRKYIGFELNKEYVNGAEQRIREADSEAKIELKMSRHKLF